jgi:hypothetical protein
MDVETTSMEDRELPADSAAMVPRSPHARSRRSTKPAKMAIDGRSDLGRRVADLAHDYAQRAGGWSNLSDTEAANITRAAELTALAEKLRADTLKTGAIDPTSALAITRLDGVAARAVRALQLDRAEREQDTGGGLAALLTKQFEQGAPESKALGEPAGAPAEPASAVGEPELGHPTPDESARMGEAPAAHHGAAPDAGAGEASDTDAAWSRMWSKPFTERGTP